MFLSVFFTDLTKEVDFVCYFVPITNIRYEGTVLTILVIYINSLSD